MPPDLQSLRQQLREKFPDAHHTPAPESLPVLDSLPALPKGAITELSPATPASGLSLILSQLLHQNPTPNIQHPTPNIQHPSTAPIALIDGRDAFDPASHGPESCSRLLWIRCHHADESIRCTDLLLRDGNLPLLVLDLQLTPARELNAIPSSSWYRLRNLARQSGATLLAFTPRPHIPAAALQLTLTSTFHLPDLESLANKLAYQRPTRTSQHQKTGT